MTESLWTRDNWGWLLVEKSHWTAYTLEYTGDAVGNISIVAGVEVEKPIPVTDTEKAADQMVRDILADKIDRTGRQQVRHAIDQKDAPPTGRTKTDGAIGRISRGW